jgi:ribosomal peptide maturation radical SAM protein 1
MLRVTLASMPWQGLESPSLPIGLLRAACVQAGLPVPSTYHGGMMWAEYLQQVTDGEIGVADYVDIAENGLFHGLGDWVFSGVLYNDDSFGIDQLAAYASTRGQLEARLVIARTMRRYSQAFIDQAATVILEQDPDVVGFTTTFMQNTASLATARVLKERQPGLAVVFGGGNCDGEMGAALHKNFSFVDFVVRGEGEKALIGLTNALNDGSGFADVPGLCWRDGARQRVNAVGPLLAPAEIPVPDFDDWFDLMDKSPVAEETEPKLVVETARGCWWGEAHHCKFCGLNGSAMQFRAKRPSDAVDEIMKLVRRHQVLDVIVVDNIIDNRYFAEVLPALAELDWDLRLHYEVKSNLSADDVAALSAGHVAHVQPGIESLISPVLRLMDKGVSGSRNVRVLRDLESASLTVSWNWLYGFPGESLADYVDVMGQLPNLVHLQPPASVARILLERFSPYYAEPGMGFPDRTPTEAYRHVYQLPESELRSLVYLFDTPPAGLSRDDAVPLVDHVHWWRDNYVNSSLTRESRRDAIIVRDQRAGRAQATHVIDDPVLVAAYRELEHGRSLGALRRCLLEDGHAITDGDLDNWVARLCADGLVFVEASQVVALATAAVPIKVKT